MPHQQSHRAKLSLRLLLVLAAALSCVTPVKVQAASTSCADLLRTSLPNTKVISAVTTEGTLPDADLVGSRGPGAQTINPYLQTLPTFCRVIAELTPVPQSRIQIEVWMPEKWNGKLLGIGCHGFCGTIERGDMAMGLRRGYAVVSSDGGHHGTMSRDPEAPTSIAFTVNWAVDKPVAVDDFAWRAVHEMTSAAKAIVQKNYGVAARHAYFDGCSNGGRQAMREAQQFPADYDGVVVGSAPLYWTRVLGSQLWMFQSGALQSGGRISRAKLALAKNAAMTACDKADGLADGLITDPLRCHWNPRVLLCKPSDDPNSCLTADEVQVIVRMENPIRNPETGELIYDGMAPGSEELWMGDLAAMGGFHPITTSYFRDLITRDPAFDPGKADFYRVQWMQDEPNSAGSKINDVNPDLAAFRARGGKILQYHGWGDQAMPPGFSSRFYGEVVDLQPGHDKLAQTQNFYRLFMAPGLAHCFGGYGPINFGGLDHIPLASLDADHDVLEALDKWVDQGKAPDRIIATQFADDLHHIVRQMPLCPYPQVAIFVGGDRTRAESFACKVPRADEGSLPSVTTHLGAN